MKRQSQHAYLQFDKRKANPQGQLLHIQRDWHALESWTCIEEPERDCLWMRRFYRLQSLDARQFALQNYRQGFSTVGF